MKNSFRLFLSFLVPFSVLAGFAASPVMSQDKEKEAKAAPAAKMEKAQNTTKVLLDNDKVRVTEATWRPGDEGPSVARPLRVSRALNGGELTRIYPDGKTEKDTYKTGEVKYLPASSPYAIKNTGKTELVLYTVQLK